MSLTAPLVHLHSEDPFRPSDILQHIRHTTPRLDFEVVRGNLTALDLDNLEVLNEINKDVALTSNDDPMQMPDWILGELPDDTGRINASTPCVVICAEKTPREIDVYYFYFYSYDRGGNISQVLEPLNTWFEMNDTEKHMNFGDHVGDWENNMIRFKDGEPQGIYYSQHVSGQAFKWNDKKVEKAGLRVCKSIILFNLSHANDFQPIVYSAYGSHANYASPG
jgi:hypothetical protein